MSAASQAIARPPEPESGPRLAAGKSRPARAALRVHAPQLGLAAAFALILGGLSLLKYRFYLYNDIDLAMFVQALERCLHGSTFVSIRGMSWLGDHASYVLFLLAPIYAVIRHPATVLVIQSVVLGLGAIPVHRMAARALTSRDAARIDSVRGEPRLAAWAVAAAYVLHPALSHLALFEFHPEIVATTALLFAIDALATNRTRACLAWASLALLAREDVALVVFALGAWATVFRRPRARVAGATLAAAALGVLTVTLLVVRPRFASVAAQYSAMYRFLGDSPSDVVTHVARDPLRALELLFATPGNPLDTRLKGEMLLHLLMPFAFLPLAAPTTLLVALPVFAEHLWSVRVQQHTILFQYSALLLPVLAWGAVEALHALSGPRPKLARRAAVAALACAVLAQVAYGPFGFGLLQSRRAIERVLPDDRDRIEAPIRDRLLARIPPAGAVIAGFEFLPRLAMRDDVHSLHHVLGGRYTYSSEPYPSPARVAAVLADWSQPRLRPYADSPAAGRRIGAIIARHGLVPVEAVGDLVLFARGRSTAPLVSIRPDLTALPRARYDRALEYLGSRVEGAMDPATGAVPIRTVWRRVARIRGVYLMRLDLLDAGRRVVATHTRVLGYIVWPVSDWALNVPVMERYAFTPGVRLSPGRYVIRMELARLGSDSPVEFDALAGGPVVLGSFLAGAARR